MSHSCPPEPLDLRRVVVIGESCSGKSTLARTLAAALGHKHVELDALFWGPAWTARGPAFREDVAREAAADTWVMDGNYSSVRSIIWPRATLIIWLNRSLVLSWIRALRRCLVRTWSGQELWAGNRESLARTFFSGESLLVWIPKTHARRRRDYRALMAERENTAAWIELRSDGEIRRFLAQVEAASMPQDAAAAATP